MAEALLRRYLEQDDRLFKSLLDEASELTDQQYPMAPLMSHNTRALLFIAVIEGGILLARNLHQNQQLTNRAPGFSCRFADALRCSPDRFPALDRWGCSKKQHDIYQGISLHSH